MKVIDQSEEDGLVKLGPVASLLFELRRRLPVPAGSDPSTPQYCTVFVPVR